MSLPSNQFKTKAQTVNSTTSSSLVWAETNQTSIIRTAPEQQRLTPHSAQERTRNQHVPHTEALKRLHSELQCIVQAVHALR